MLRTTEGLQVPPARGWLLSLPITAAVAGLLLDALLIFAAASGLIPPRPALVSHLILVGAVTLAVNRLTSPDLALPVVSGLAMLAAGPVAMVAACAILAWPGQRRAQHPAARENEAVELPHLCDTDAAHDLSEAIMSGRAANPASGQPENFLQVITTGDLDKAQMLLGHIGLHYDPSYLPILKIALRSTRPGLRAQSAAIYAKLRAEFAARFKAALQGITASPFAAADGAADEGELQKHLDDLSACIASNILDASELRAGARALAPLAARSASKADAARILAQCQAQLDAADCNAGSDDHATDDQAKDDVTFRPEDARRLIRAHRRDRVHLARQAPASASYSPLDWPVGTPQSGFLAAARAEK